MTLFEFVAQSYSWFASKPGPWLIALWCLMGTVTIFFRLRSPSEWVQVADRSPRLHGVMVLVRRVFPDVPGALAALVQILTGVVKERGIPLADPPPPDVQYGAPVRIVGIELDDAAPTRPIPPDRGMTRVDAIAFLGALALLASSLSGAVWTMGCSWLRANEPAIINAAEVVIHLAEEACTFVPFFDSSGIAANACIKLPDVEVYLRELAAAEAEKRPARFSVVGIDGVKRAVEIPAQHVAMAHANAKAASLRGPR